MVCVGVVANPASGRDVRRLVTGASVFDDAEKGAMVHRLMAGLGAAGVDRGVDDAGRVGRLPEPPPPPERPHRAPTRTVEVGGRRLRYLERARGGRRRPGG